MKRLSLQGPNILPSRRGVLRALAGVGLGSQFDVRQKPPTCAFLSRLWNPGALDVHEEQSEALQILARRYAPAMAFGNANMWPVDVSYSWHEGSGVYSEKVAGQRREVVSHESLCDATKFHAPPQERSPQRYYIDVPGGVGGQEPWCKSWRRIQGQANPKHSPYPPTQYVHGFWLNRAEGLLALQYWFYYPYNDWVNRHEGDWEHIVIVLKGPSALAEAESFDLAGHLFHFHDWIHQPAQTIRLGGSDPKADHVVVFVGGSGDLWRIWRCGRQQSGGSYPWPGHYSRAGSEYQWVAPSERIAQPERFIPPEDFRLVTLPEPQRVNEHNRPELWWLAWPVYFGQRNLDDSFAVFRALGLDHPPTHPGFHRDWNAARPKAEWPGKFSPGKTPILPPAWAQRQRTPSTSRATLVAAR